MSRWRIHGLALCGFLIFPAIAAWVDLNGPAFLRWLFTAFAIAALAVYAGATSAVVKIFRLERTGILILHGCFFAIALTIFGVLAALGAANPGAGTQIL
jgi:hypothetical protein